MNQQEMTDRIAMGQGFIAALEFAREPVLEHLAAALVAAFDRRPVIIQPAARPLVRCSQMPDRARCRGGLT